MPEEKQPPITKIRADGKICEFVPAKPNAKKDVKAEINLQPDNDIDESIPEAATDLRYDADGRAAAANTGNQAQIHAGEIDRVATSVRQGPPAIFITAAESIENHH